MSCSFIFDMEMGLHFIVYVHACRYTCVCVCIFLSVLVMHVSLYVCAWMSVYASKIYRVSMYSVRRCRRPLH